MKIFKFSEYQLRKYDFKLVIFIMALSVLGYLLVSSAMVNDRLRDSTLQKQMIGIAAGVIFMVVLSLVDYHVLLRIAPIVYLGVLLLLGLVLVMGTNLNNATRWLELPGGIQIQPSEFAKPGLILSLSAFFFSVQDRINRPLVVLSSVGLLAVPAFLIYREPDLSTTLVILFIFVCLIYVAKISYKWIFGAIGAMIPVGAVVVYRALRDESKLIRQYQLNRILAWLFPDRFESLGLTTQQDNSVLAISSGQLYGKGLNTTSFESVKNGNFLSEENCDFIFAVIGEELGFIGSVIVITLIFFIVAECFLIAFRAKDMGGRLFAAGMGSLVAFQAAVNIVVATGMLPNTGLPLPFMSAGVSSLLSMFIGMGVVLNIGLQRRNTDADW